MIVETWIFIMHPLKRNLAGWHKERWVLICWFFYCIKPQGALHWMADGWSSDFGVWLRREIRKTKWGKLWVKLLTNGPCVWCFWERLNDTLNSEVSPKLQSIKLYSKRETRCENASFVWVSFRVFWKMFITWKFLIQIGNGRSTTNQDFSRKNSTMGPKTFWRDLPLTGALVHQSVEYSSPGINLPC